MAGLDSLRHVTIGQYYPGHSAIHRLDARAKILVFILLTIAALIADGLVSSFLIVVLVLVGVRSSRIPARAVIANLRPAIPVVILFSCLQILFYEQGSDARGISSSTLFTWGSLSVTRQSITVALVSVMRFVSLFVLIVVMMGTTRQTSLTRAVETLLRPFSKIGIPGHELAMVMAIAFRFLPILGEQMTSIASAQEARGLSVGAKSRWRLVANARRVATLVVPLFVDAYRRTDDLGVAMAARCYQGGRDRTYLVPPAMTRSDYAAMVLAGITIAIVVLVRCVGVR